MATTGRWKKWSCQGNWQGNAHGCAPKNNPGEDGGGDEDQDEMGEGEEGAVTRLATKIATQACITNRHMGTGRGHRREPEACVTFGHTVTGHREEQMETEQVRQKPAGQCSWLLLPGGFGLDLNVKTGINFDEGS